MALKQCQNCGKSYDFKSPTCLHCGAPNPSHRSNKPRSNLAECVECGGKVSKSAKTCPHCGGVPTKLMKASKGLRSCGCLGTIFITLPILLLFLFGMCG